MIKVFSTNLSVKEHIYANQIEGRRLPVFFYSHEPNKPAHLHVDEDSATAKIWLHKLSVASNVGFLPRET